MTPERYRRIGEVFASISAAPPHERAALLSAACGSDMELREELESLLAAHNTREPAVDGAVDGAAVPRWLGPGSSAAAAQDEFEAVQDSLLRIGRFQVVRRIGQGGMGVVYEARQDHPARRVALKVIRGGFPSGDARRRFQLESEVLGLLNDPGIAQIYEAGEANAETEAGAVGRFPYFAMELVDGCRLDQFVAAAQLDVRGRVSLVARICDALHHAHQKGVIHRDLKPANIVVSSQSPPDTTPSTSTADAPADPSARPVILDFGVARLTDRSRAASSINTLTGQMVGTLAYMSPEQFTADPAAIDTRCDIYSVGVILFELLAGQLPFDVNGRSVVDAARIVTGNSTPRLGRISPSLRGDLDVIVAKAMAQDRQHRYASAAELAADLRRYLGRRPILARPPSTMYHVWRFAQRNRALVASLLLGLVILVAGIASTWRERNAAIAERTAAVSARDAARLQADRAQALNDFMLNHLFQVSRPRHGGSEHMTVSALLDNALAGLDQVFAAHPAQEGGLRSAIGRVLLQFKSPADAEAQFRRALELLTKSDGESAPDTRRAMYFLAGALADQGKLDDAQSILNRLATLESAAADGGGTDHAATLISLGRNLFQTGKPAQAIPLYEEALALLGRHGALETADAITALDHLAAARIMLRQYAAADKTLQQVVAGWKRLYGADCFDLIMAYTRSGQAAMFLRDYARAQEFLDRALEIATRRGIADSLQASDILTANSELRRAQGDFAGAERFQRRLVELRNRLLPTNDIRRAAALDLLAFSRLLQGDRKEAEAIFREARDIYVSLGVNSADMAQNAAALGSAIYDQTRYAEALPFFQDALRIAQSLTPDDPAELGYYRIKLGLCLLGLKRYAESEPLLIAAYEGLLPRDGPTDRFVLGSVEALRILYAKTNQPEKAMVWSARGPQTSTTNANAAAGGEPASRTGAAGE